jgi:hypothetical protein
LPESLKKAQENTCRMGSVVGSDERHNSTTWLLRNSRWRLKNRGDDKSDALHLLYSIVFTTKNSVLEHRYSFSGQQEMCKQRSADAGESIQDNSCSAFLEDPAVEFGVQPCLQYRRRLMTEQGIYTLTLDLKADS